MNLVVYKFAERKPERAGMYLCGAVYGEGPDAYVVWYDLPYSIKYKGFNAYDEQDESYVAEHRIDVTYWAELPHTVSGIVVSDAS